MEEARRQVTPSAAGNPPVPDRESLLAAARVAAQAAYAPYSRFRVGAVVLADDGRLFSGCNVENASYGLCLCAERNALASAIAAGARRFTAVAVTCLDASPALGPEGRSPCGACRQWLLELAPDATIHLDGIERPWTSRELLPLGFVLNPSQP
jgi:cytidine deaminase